MVESLRRLRRTAEGSFRAQPVGFHMPDDPFSADGEPMVEVTMLMPLGDSRRFAELMAEWVELHVSQAILADHEPPSGNT